MSEFLPADNSSTADPEMKKSKNNYIICMRKKFESLNFVIEQQKSEIRCLRNTLKEIKNGAEVGLLQRDKMLEQLNLDAKCGDF